MPENNAIPLEQQETSHKIEISNYYCLDNFLAILIEDLTDRAVNHEQNEKRDLRLDYEKDFHELRTVRRYLLNDNVYYLVEALAVKAANTLVFCNRGNNDIKTYLQIDILRFCLYCYLDGYLSNKNLKDETSDMDIAELIKIRDMLAKALNDIPQSDGNRTFHLIVSKAIDGLDRQLATTPTPAVATDTPQSPALTLPEPFDKKHPKSCTYERWANRKNKDEKPSEFIRRVWGNHIDSGVLYRSDLVGQTKTKTNPNPKKPLDATLFNELWKQAQNDKDLIIDDVLPNNKERITREIIALDVKIDDPNERNAAVYKKLQRAR